MGDVLPVGWQDMQVICQSGQPQGWWLPNISTITTTIRLKQNNFIILFIHLFYKWVSAKDKDC
jgi:hypothetical protein